MLHPADLNLLRFALGVSVSDFYTTSNKEITPQVSNLILHAMYILSYILAG